MFFWNASDLTTAHAFVTVNSLAQLYYVAARLAPMDTGSWSSMLTHVVSKTFAGIGVLDLLHNGSVAFAENSPVTPLVKGLTGAGFLVASALSDWILGGCLVYDLVALSVGQRSYDQSWSTLLGGYAAACGAVVGLKNWLR